MNQDQTRMVDVVRKELAGGWPCGAYNQLAYLTTDPTIAGHPDVQALIKEFACTFFVEPCVLCGDMILPHEKRGHGYPSGYYHEWCWAVFSRLCVQIWEALPAEDGDVLEMGVLPVFVRGPLKVRHSWTDCARMWVATAVTADERAVESRVIHR